MVAAAIVTERKKCQQTNNYDDDDDTFDKMIFLGRLCPTIIFIWSCGIYMYWNAVAVIIGPITATPSPTTAADIRHRLCSAISCYICYTIWQWQWKIHVFEWHQGGGSSRRQTANRMTRQTIITMTQSQKQSHLLTYMAMKFKQLAREKEDKIKIKPKEKKLSQ